ncbi:MAG TPA: carbonic anhydrase [Chthoniobacterales bacterium]|nr:carbonic anhydrase [Chthoniobacterales bacterium]
MTKRILTIGFIFAAAVCNTSTGAEEPAKKASGTTSPAASDEPLQTELDLKLREALVKGASMEEIAKLKEPGAKTPQEAIRALKSGNSRFFGGMARRPELSANERRAQILQQTPFAAVLGCSDSRVPVELVFDQGLGDIFAVRVAGQIVEPGTAGSFEYAVKHLKTKVLVIMGHEGCGAVKAAMLPSADQKAEPQHVRYLLDQITPAVTNIAPIRDPKAKMREAVMANVRKQVALAKENPVVKSAVAKNELAVVGAFYEISSGQVDFLETEEELRLN